MRSRNKYLKVVVQPSYIYHTICPNIWNFHNCLVVEQQPPPEKIQDQPHHISTVQTCIFQKQICGKLSLCVPVNCRIPCLSCTSSPLTPACPSPAQMFSLRPAPLFSNVTTCITFSRVCFNNNLFHDPGFKLESKAVARPVLFESALISSCSGFLQFIFTFDSFSLLFKYIVHRALNQQLAFEQTFTQMM